MEDRIYDETPSSKEVGIGIFLGFGYFTIFPVIPLILLLAVFGPVAEDSLQATKLSLIAQLITALIVVVLMFLLSKVKIARIFKNLTPDIILKGLMYAVISYVLVVVYGIIDTKIFGEVSSNENQTQVVELIKNFPLLGVVFTVIAAPIIEELTYRYYLFKGLEKRNIVLAFVVTVFLFAAMHLIPSIGSENFIQDLRSLPAYLIASFILTLAYYRHEKLFVPIFAHVFYNGFATIMVLLSI